MTFPARLKGLTLSPHVRLVPTFPFDASGWIEASMAFHLDPRLLAGATGIFEAMSRALKTICNAAAVQERPLPRDRAQRLIHGVAASELASRPWLGEWLDWRKTRDGGLRLALRNAPVSVPDPERTPVRLAVTHGSRSRTISLTVGELAHVRR